MTVINLDGVVGWEILASEVNNLLDNSTGDITFDLNSGGGFITEGVSILNKIRSYDKGKTIARISYAASMMTQIALACDEVQIYDNGIFMIHNAQGIAIGDHRELRKTADMQDRMSGMLSQLYANRSGKTVEEVRQLMDADTWLFGSEVVEMGFADTVLDMDKDKKKDKKKDKEMAQALFQRATSAIKKEALSLNDLEKNYKMCVGNCSISNEKVATDALLQAKTVNLNTGVTMKFNRENLDETEAQFNALVLNRDTLSNRNESLKLNLETKTVALETLQAEMDTLKTSKDAEVAGAKASLESFKAETTTRLEEASENNLSVNVALAMVNAEDKDASSKLALEAKTSNGGSRQGDGSQPTEKSALMAFAEANKGSVR